jgi:hypothetical protein
MFRRKLDAETRLAMASYAGQLIAFAIGAVHFGL